MTKIYADNYRDAFKQFKGGYWAQLVIPFETWTLRPDGSIASLKPNKLNSAAIATLAA